MTKIYCAAVNCVYNNDNSVCTAKKVALSWHSVNTVWEGRQEYNKCKTYQMSPESAEILERMHEARIEREKKARI